MNNSWIKLHRKLFDWEWYTDSQTVHLFLHLLLKANYKPSKWRGVDIGVGQLLTGRKQLSVETGISERSVRTILDRLKSTSELTIKSTSKFSIITLCNYSRYQADVRTIDQQIDHPEANDRPASDQQATTSNNLNTSNTFKDSTLRPQQAGGSPPCPHQEIVNAYHTILPELRRVRSWTDKRQGFLRSRWKEDSERQTVEWWERYFNYVRKCPWLMGVAQSSSGNTFQADLEWLVRPTNFLKVIEGKYES